MYERKRKAKAVRTRKPVVVDDATSYRCTTITIAQNLRAFLRHNAGKCFTGTCRIKGNSGFIGELLQREYDRQCASGEWENGK